MSPTLRALQQQAQALQQQGRLQEAVVAYQQLLGQQPALPDSWYNLGYLLKALAQPEAALSAYQHALQHGVRGPEEVHLNRAVIYTDLLRRDEPAQLELERALQINPGYAPALLNLGNLHEEHGRREHALSCYEQIVACTQGDAEQQRLRAEALSRMAHLRQPTDADDPLLAQLNTAALAQPPLPPTTLANVLFALGRACDALGLPDRAFAAFAQANRSAAQTGPAYDPARAERYTQALQQIFASAVHAVDSGDALHHWEPLFICGMFRSGSTLLEQVLGAHPLVQPGGELDFFPRLVATRLAPFPAAAASLTPSANQALARDYWAHVQQLFPHAAVRYISDKRPDNYALIGLIKQVLPRARFIHTVRDPRDVGLSIFMHHLDQRILSYSTRLADIGHHCGQYVQLMAHWKQLYGDSIIDFDYDQFVRDPKPALQSVLEFLGLDWDDACLQFHSQRNSVKTASYWQVRRPLYGDASGRWRSYQHQLNDLLSAFRAAGVRLPD